MNHAKHLSVPLRAALILLGAIALAAAPATARAKTITVNTLTDEATAGDRLCSLREAINNANSATDTTDGDCVAGTGDDVIDFKVEGTITLTSTLPEIIHTLKIDGGGQIAIQGTFTSLQVLLVSSGATLEVDNLTIENGDAGIGAAIDDEGGTLTVRNSTFSNNTAFDCGAIFASGPLFVTNSTFVGNVAQGGNGGAICGGGTITSSLFVGNSAGIVGTVFGGAIFATAALAVTNSTFAGNLAHGGGAISGGTVTNCTFFRNTSRDFLFGVVMAGVSNSILAGNSPTNCGVIGGLGNGADNISDDDSCGFGTTTAANGQVIGDNVDPLLDPNGLQNNGGPTQTIALQPGSPAIDAIPAANCPEVDQRGVNRPDNFETACDIGSYEFFDFAGTPGQKDCRGDSISALSKQFGKLTAAASALGFPSVKTLKRAIQAFCRG